MEVTKVGPFIFYEDSMSIHSVANGFV
jgi:hypothetical protein